MRPFFLIFLTGGALLAAPPPESAAVQELRLSLERIEQKLHSQTVELQLMQERALTLENSLKSENKGSALPLDKRVLALEKANDALITDMKALKGHINETAATLSQCQTQINKIDKQLTSDIQSLKSSLNTMLSLLQNNATQESRFYTVQPGDSLGQIAVTHKTDIKTLKKLNSLSADTIYVGQKLIIPN